MVRVDIVEDVKMVEMTSENICSTFSQLKSGIQSTQNKFKLIKFGINKRRQVGKSVGYGNVIAGIANILVFEDNNCLPFKNNFEYAWARFMQASKMTKRSMTIFFTNSNLASMREYLSYKNVDKMRALLTELLYSKITW